MVWLWSMAGCTSPASTVQDPGDEAPEDCSGAYTDDDGDGYGAAFVAEVCPGSGLVAEGGDCDDANIAIHPGAEEGCDGVDANCNGLTAEAGDQFVDSDGDGWWVMLSECQEGASAYQELLDAGGQLTDCDDAQASAYPGAEELCGDGIANDCESGGSDQDCFDFEVTDCPAFWPVDSLEGLTVSFSEREGDSAALAHHAEIEVHGARAWMFSEGMSRYSSDKHSYSSWSVTDGWALSCTAEGVVRLQNDWWWSSSSDSSSSSEEGVVSYSEPALVLPAALEVGVTWTDQVDALFEFEENSDSVGGTVQHTVTACGAETLPGAGEVTLCWIESTDSVGVWAVAEGLGPVVIGDRYPADIVFH